MTQSQGVALFSLLEEMGVVNAGLLMLAATGCVDVDGILAA